MNHIEKIINEKLNEQFIIFCGTVVMAENRVYNVKPLYKTGYDKDFSIIEDVPLLNWGGRINVPLSVGDLVVCASLKHSLNQLQGEFSINNNVLDTHSLADVFILQSYVDTSPTDDGLILKVGGSTIKIKENEIEITSGSGMNVIIDGVNFKQHTHTASPDSISPSVAAVIGGGAALPITTGGVNP